MSTLFQHRTKLLSIYRVLHDQPGLFIDGEGCADLQNQAQRLLAATLQIAFIGRFSVGKSQLINRLFLGADVLTVALKPTTARLMYIQYGEKPALWLVRRGADGRPERQALATPGADASTIADAIKRHTTHLGNVQNEDVGAYQLDWPDGRFFQDGVQLVDTIGTEDIDDRFVDATYTAISQSDAVVMIVNMTQPLTASEQRFIEEHLGRTGKKVFLAVNKADTRSPDEQQEVLRNLHQRFTHLYQNSQVHAEDRIFAVSAKTGLGLDELRERLVRFVAEERLSEILHGHQVSLNQRLTGAILRCQKSLAEHQAKKDGAESQLREARERLHTLGKDLERQYTQLDDVRDDLELTLKDGVRDLRQWGDQALGQFRQGTLGEQTIRTELAILYRDGSEQLAADLQRQARKVLQRRIGIIAGIDPANIEKLNDSSGQGLSRAILATGAVSGTALVTGGTAVLTAAHIALATTPSWFGSASLWTLFAGALAPWALPVVASGVALAVATKRAVDRERAKNREAFLEEAKSKLREDISAMEQELRKQMEAYITKIWAGAEKEVKREGQSLEQLIAETDPTALEHHINALLAEKMRLTDIVQQLEKLAVQG